MYNNKKKYKELIAPQLRSLGVFERISFPSRKAQIVFNACYTIKRETDWVKQFTTRTDRKSGLIHVIRTK